MPDTTTSHNTEDALAALRASDPAAFDDDVLEDKQTETPDAGTTDADRATAEKAEDEQAAAEAEAAKKDERTIDKRQYDGVLGDLRDTRGALAQERARAEALANELAALKAGPPVDYTAEIKGLDDAWNNDTFDGSHDEYLSKRDGLIAGRAEQAAIERYEKERAEIAAKQAAEQWAVAANAFVEAHPEYRDADTKSELEAALHGVFAKFPDSSDSDKLERAHKIVLAMNGKIDDVPKSMSEGRDKADAQAAVKASSQPPAINGGVSSSGGPIGNVDFASLKQGQFSKLSKDQQAAALGGIGAL